MTTSALLPTAVTSDFTPLRVGHKFARLEELRRAGFPVPGFFCLPVDEFDRALEAVGGDLPDDRPDPAAWCAAAARSLESAEPAGALAARVLAEFDERIGAGNLAAVRACVVPDVDGVGEDTADDPFAGMSESFLYVPRTEVLSAVARCWASAFKPEAVQYRLLKGIDPTRARIAVGIQRMALGTRSFVAFTRDPRDGGERCVIAAAHGIGEGVVQEKADIDHFFVDPATGRVRTQAVKKRWMIGPPPQPLQPVPDRLADEPVLTEQQAREVAALAQRVETHFGTPQDIEGTFTPDGAVHLVQARPMVIAPPESPRPVYWGNHNITESYPGISSALTYSQARIFYQKAFTDLYRRMGVRERKIRADGHRLARMIGHLDGRVYYRLNDWQVLHGRLPAFDLVRTEWEQAMGITGAARAPGGRSRLRIVANLPLFLWHAAGHRRASKRFFRWWDQLMTEVYATDRATVEDLIARYHRVWEETGRHWGVTLSNGLYMGLAIRAGKALLQRWAGAGPDLFVGLLCGGRENRSLAAARAAIALAEQASALPELRERLLAPYTEDSDRQLWDDIAAGRHGTELAGAVRAYLERYGDRALHDLKLDEATPRQRPSMLVGVLRPFVRQGTTVAGNRAAEHEQAEQARRQLRRACRNPLRRAVLHALLGVARWGIRMREDARFCRTQLFGITRDVMWRLGAELTAAGVLADPHDVVDLTVEEVVGAFDGTVPGPPLASLAALRRTERERQATAAPHPTLMSVPGDGPLTTALRAAVPVGDSAAEDGSGLLRGLGSSGGRVRGRALVVLDPSVAPDDCRDRILIARETDPGWLPLMIAASGLVVERGTLLSHTAITGRLLGVPTVVAVPKATTRIPDGAWIELDGGEGTVRLLAEPPGADADAHSHAPTAN
ncbi:PEP/pyruvate-binding domain-containing protein [Streptomyces sp. DH-12]|uniref:PEP/pyruvate-binding domain-containing protein n=1 Tax=unclassified Streptomyces TaxID=2593676 RepID=UPI0018E4C2E5|nr:PEP/pyruvate-binding domain-containing protein [Streptomyces sp. DH-12]